MEAVKKFLGFALVAMFVTLPACQKDENFTPLSAADVFLQDFNPETLDILWVIDDRSPMYYAQAQLLKYASAFFTRLDNQARDYRMGFTSADMRIAQGKLKNGGNPIVRSQGTAADRLNLFKNIIGNILNLRTGFDNQGLMASVFSLKDHFKPRANVPLVVVYISYEADGSVVPTGTPDALQYFKDQLLALKGNKDLVRVYAINFFPAPGKRCIDDQVYEIDQPGYVNNYFEIADYFDGDTGDICAGELDTGFATKIDLTGLRMKTLPKRFKLSQPVGDEADISVEIFNAAGSFDMPWTIDHATNELVFNVAPPEGTTIRVVYLTK